MINKIIKINIVIIAINIIFIAGMKDNTIYKYNKNGIIIKQYRHGYLENNQIYKTEIINIFKVN